MSWERDKYIFSQVPSVLRIKQTNKHIIMGRDVFVVLDKVRLKPVSSATETS